MNSALSQIQKSYEELGMTVEQICLDQNLDEYAVKSALMQCSSLYRKACRTEPEGECSFNFTEEQQARACQRIFDLTMSDDEHVALKAATFVRDDFKGRKDVVKAVQGSTFNILTINEAIKSARVGAQRMRQTISI